MVGMNTFLAFFAAAFVLAITPGPGLAYVVARTVSGGRSEGLASCFGTALGGLLQVMAAALGLSLVLAQSAAAFTLVKYAGAAYLVYLGVRLVLRRVESGAPPAVEPRGAKRAFLEGIAVEALNVKTALFFVAFLPQFVDPAGSVPMQLLVLGTICVGLNTGVDVVAVFAAGRLLRSQAVRAARARLMNRVSGATMIALGVSLAMARKP